MSTNEIPLKEENLEQALEAASTEIHAEIQQEAPVVVPETKESREEAINKKYEEIIATKPTGEELLEASPLEINTDAVARHQEKSRTSWTSKLKNLAFGVTALFGVSAANATHAENTNPDDSTKIKKEASLEIPVKEGLKIRPVTAQERMEWNQFLDFVKEKGYEGSKELDKKSDALARKLFDEFKKLHPETTLSYELVASIQYEMHKLRQTARGFAKRHNDANADIIMSGISKVDGWFGSQTSQYKFPAMFLDSYHNNNLVKSENLGLVGSDMQTARSERSKKPLPPGVKLMQYEDGVYYEDPQSGDLVKYK